MSTYVHTCTNKHAHPHAPKHNLHTCSLKRLPSCERYVRTRPHVGTYVHTKKPKIKPEPKIAPKYKIKHEPASLKHISKHTKACRLRTRSHPGPPLARRRSALCRSGPARPTEHGPTASEQEDRQRTGRLRGNTGSEKGGRDLTGGGPTEVGLLGACVQRYGCERPGQGPAHVRGADLARILGSLGWTCHPSPVE